MNLIDRLHSVVDRYCTATGFRREQVSYRIFSDQRRLGLVIEGEKGMTVASFERAMTWFSANWPADLDWPEGIERPRAGQLAE